MSLSSDDIKLAAFYAMRYCVADRFAIALAECWTFRYLRQLVRPGDADPCCHRCAPSCINSRSL